MIKLPANLLAKLAERKEKNAFRQLSLPHTNKIDFCSNDYLGIVKNYLLLYDKSQAAAISHNLKSGSTGSRLLTGNYPLIEETEHQIASFHDAEAALLFNSGYDANVGILSCVPQKGDTIIYDALCHASIRDGIRLSFAHSYSFGHNDMDDLQKKVKQANGTIFIVTESVFSMDGDVCPLQKISELCVEYNAYLILDEAHAIGVIGEQGEGLSQHLQLHTNIFCRIYTFGKACGCHGAAAVCSKELKDYLVNFSRSFIYSTALPEHSVALIQKSYTVFPSLQKERKHLNNLINQFQQASKKYETMVFQTPIQTVLITGNSEAKKKATWLQQKGIDVRPILYPTVPKGKERLRIILHAFNTADELNLLITVL